MKTRTALTIDMEVSKWRTLLGLKGQPQNLSLIFFYMADQAVPKSIVQCSAESFFTIQWCAALCNMHAV
jgi:hypothetical protein